MNGGRDAMNRTVICTSLFSEFPQCGERVPDRRREGFMTEFTVVGTDGSGTFFFRGQLDAGSAPAVAEAGGICDFRHALLC
jgi:hypothetical protein